MTEENKKEEEINIIVLNKLAQTYGYKDFADYLDSIVREDESDVRRVIIR